MDETDIKARLNDLKRFVETARTGAIPKGRVILYAPAGHPIDPISPGIWTDDPAFTAIALWTKAQAAWPNRTAPSQAAVIENATQHLEIIARWASDETKDHSK